MTAFTFGPVDIPRARAWSAHARQVLRGEANPWTSHPVDQSATEAAAPYSDRLLAALRHAGPDGLTVPEQRQVFGRNVPARDITTARAQLVALDLARLTDDRRLVAATTDDPYALRLEHRMSTTQGGGPTTGRPPKPGPSATRLHISAT